MLGPQSKDKIKARVQRSGRRCKRDKAGHEAMKLVHGPQKASSNRFVRPCIQTLPGTPESWQPLAQLQQG
jgi:hypothetical protein